LFHFFFVLPSSYRVVPTARFSYAESNTISMHLQHLNDQIA
jgi:hypothetical protein